VVLSLRAPYTCPDCGAELTVLLDAASLGGRPQAPTQPCKACGGTMELDEVPEIYFSFLAAQEKVATPARVDALRTMARHAPAPRAGHVDQ
jgi:transcription elongation factor Elf1